MNRQRTFGYKFLWHLPTHVNCKPAFIYIYLPYDNNPVKSLSSIQYMFSIYTQLFMLFVHVKCWWTERVVLLSLTCPFFYGHGVQLFTNTSFNCSVREEIIWMLCKILLKKCSPAYALFEQHVVPHPYNMLSDWTCGLHMYKPRLLSTFLTANDTLLAFQCPKKNPYLSSGNLKSEQRFLKIWKSTMARRVSLQKIKIGVVYRRTQSLGSPVLNLDTSCYLVANKCSLLALVANIWDCCTSWSWL